MKIKYIIIAFCICFCNMLLAQERVVKERTKNYVPQKGDYVQDLNAANFYGIWIWKEGDKEFKLILTKRKQTFPKMEVAMDVVNLHYIFSKNGKVIINSTKSDGFSEDNKVLKINFLDEKMGKVGEATLTLKDNSSKAVWELHNPEGLKMGNYNPDFSVPTSMVLEKQN